MSAVRLIALCDPDAQSPERLERLEFDGFSAFFCADAPDFDLKDHHSQVIAAAETAKACLPGGRHGIFANLERLTDWINAQHAHICDRLAEVEDHVEYVVRLVQNTPAAPPLTSSQSGRTYLRSRMASRQHDEATLKAIEKQLGELIKPLSEVKDVRMEVHRDGERVIASANLLVRENRSASLECAMKRLPELILAGPFPPYSFVDLRTGDAHE